MKKNRDKASNSFFIKLSVGSLIVKKFNDLCQEGRACKAAELIIVLK
jgi:hypothetical protein